MAKQRKQAEKFDDLMADMDTSTAIPYTMTTCFKVNDLLNHPVFGLGKVIKCLSPNKIHVMFREGEKFLIGVLPQDIE
ncbi:hypothetical protein MNBD_DELTA03-629 [hydrothermal vent metagenome]|uniref:Uncharacterized protein n=1 Tax=hydrothermal vent metagenome TaxID=652676 RepID=A0A3B0UWU8_9ZZZZ